MWIFFLIIYSVLTASGMGSRVVDKSEIQNHPVKT